MCSRSRATQLGCGWLETENAVCVPVWTVLKHEVSRRETRNGNDRLRSRNGLARLWLEKIGAHR